MSIVAMLPTYNERDNISDLIRRILALRDDIEVLVVDDNSPDGTAGVALELAGSNPRVHLIVRSGPRGRGYAGAEGFRRAVEMGYDLIIEMDADWSHDPQFIPQLIAASERCDLVIGSRFVPGGSQEGRSFSRIGVSALANFYLRIILGFSSIKDCTSGFRCFRRELLEAIEPGTLRSRGPSIVGEALFRCRGARIMEIPITFYDRKHGRSKFSFRAMFANIIMAPKLRIISIFCPRRYFPKRDS